MLLAVAQSRSLHVVHEAYFCESCFRDAIYQHFKEDLFRPEEGEATEAAEAEAAEAEAAEKRASEKEPCRLLINSYNFMQSLFI